MRRGGRARRGVRAAGAGARRRCPPADRAAAGCPGTAEPPRPCRRAAWRGGGQGAGRTARPPLSAPVAAADIARGAAGAGTWPPSPSPAPGSGGGARPTVLSGLAAPSSPRPRRRGQPAPAAAALARWPQHLWEAVGGVNGIAEALYKSYYLLTQSSRSVSSLQEERRGRLRDPSCWQAVLLKGLFDFHTTQRSRRVQACSAGRA